MPVCAPDDSKSKIAGHERAPDLNRPGARLSLGEVGYRVACPTDFRPSGCDQNVQLPGLGSSMRRAAPAGTSDTT